MIKIEFGEMNEVIQNLVWLKYKKNSVKILIK